LDKLNIPNISCKINAYCQVNPSEDPQKVERAVSNVLSNMDIHVKDDSLKATSTTLESLLYIHEKIHSRNTQKVYGRNLKRNLVDDSTWFYLNKQAAFVDVVTLCENADESPLGPIKIMLQSKHIENIIEWLVSNSQ
jgi:predicted RNA binding protein with dsRBD fold (UPF0201 family)